MAESAGKEHIGVLEASQYAATEGGTMRPIYGERRPMMYHLLESEVKSISSLNAFALSFFSIGSFVSSIVVCIVVAALFSTAPPTELQQLLMYKVAPLLGILALLFYGFGSAAVISKRSQIDEIKRETVIK